MRRSKRAFRGGAAAPAPRIAALASRFAAFARRLPLAFALTTTLTGCGFGYYGRLALEQGRFLRRARPIEAVMAESDDRERKARLAMVLALRDFAVGQGVDPGGSYRSVSDVEGLAVAHVVTAAYRDRLEPYTWRYPLVGRIPYRGFFDPARAEAAAAELRTQGYDTLVVRAAAYSTLGWFDDPLPSSLLDSDEVTLAATVLHELAHQRLFVRDHIAFNETFANAVGMRLAILFFAQRSESDRQAEARRRYRDWLERSRFFDELASRLRESFARAHAEGLDAAERLSSRARLYEQAQEAYRRAGLALGAGDEFLRGPLDNARFLAAYRYARHAQAFDRFFESFSSMPEALEELHRRLDEKSDPYGALVVE